MRFAPTAAVLALAAASAQAAPINAGLYTTYSFAPTTINWLTCGSVQGSSGCFGAGQLTGFVKVCAIIQGAQHIKGDVVTQHVYVFDNQFSQKKGGIVLTDYKKTDTITQDGDTTVFTVSGSATLQLTSGRGRCLAAAGPAYLFAGTTTDTSAVRIAKADLSETALGGFSPPIPLSTITADNRGYVAVNYNGGGQGASGFYLFAPDGSLAEDGGGNQVLLNEVNALTP